MIKAWSLAAAVALVPLASLAQETDNTTPGASDSGEGHSIGGGRMRASVRGLAFYTDNFYYQPQDAESGTGVVIGPTLAFVRQSPKVEMVGALDGEYGLFTTNSNDDYLDYGMRLALGSQMTLRNRVRLDGEYKHGHDAFGVERTEGSTAHDLELDEWNRASGALHYRYGAPGAMLNGEVGVGAMQKEYTTNEAATAFLNYDSTTFDYTLFYNYSSKTSFLVDFTRDDFSFDRPFGLVDDRGGELYRTRVGVKWLATGKTSGDARVGYRRRTFDSGASDLSGADWEIGVDWAPVPRSSLRLETAYSEEESYFAAARVIDVHSYSVDWKYNVSARLRSQVRGELYTSDFDGTSRKDDVTNLTVGAEYLALSYLWAVGNLGYGNRDSSIAGREYDRLTAFVGVRLGR